jgi:hypothetical protein
MMLHAQKASAANNTVTNQQAGWTFCHELYPITEKNLLDT